jgi:hypothetical protein
VRPQQIRFLVEAAVIVAIAAGSGLAHLGEYGIAAAVATAWIAVSIVEFRISRR